MQCFGVYFLYVYAKICPLSESSEGIGLGLVLKEDYTDCSCSYIIVFAILYDAVQTPSIAISVNETGAIYTHSSIKISCSVGTNNETIQNIVANITLRAPNGQSNSSIIGSNSEGISIIIDSVNVTDAGEYFCLAGMMSTDFTINSAFITPSRVANATLSISIGMCLL